MKEEYIEEYIEVKIEVKEEFSVEVDSFMTVSHSSGIINHTNVILIVHVHILHISYTYL